MTPANLSTYPPAISNDNDAYFFEYIAIAFTIIFIVLKLAKLGAIATWSWWLVTSPLWGYYAVIISPIILSSMFAGIRRDWS